MLTSFFHLFLYRPKYSYCPKATTNSSTRVRIGARILSEHENVNFIKETLSSTKKKKRIRELCKVVTSEEDHSKVFGVNNSLISFDPALLQNEKRKEGNLIYYPVSQLEQINTIDGIQCINTDGVIQFVLVPRKISIHDVTKSKVMETLSFLKKNRPQLNRGNLRSNNFYSINHSYVIFGKSPKRYGKGSIDCELKNDPNHFYANRITKLMRSIERKVSMYLPTSMINTLLYVKNELIQYEAIKSYCKKQNAIWTSLSHAVNYNSVSHVDEDFFLSACSVNEDNGKRYELNSRVITNFCFPTLKKTVCLRDGDILIFNPLTYHCCSKKEQNVLNDVHIYSLYLKSKHVSLNDNSIELPSSIQLLKDI